MGNHITGIELRHRTITAAMAEVQIAVRTANPNAHLQLRGRLTGPRCAFATTVEVAYHLRPVPEAAGEELLARVVIPEPSLWDPQSPFLYRGPIELWDQNSRLDSASVCHGLRQFRAGPQGVRVNGRPLSIRAKEMADACSEDEARALRQAGYNTLIAPVSGRTASLWDVADRLGFLVVGRLAVANDETFGLVEHLRQRASCLGWLAEAPDNSLPGLLAAETVRSLGHID
jgi:beta-galactosidase/beta-glucuronidase